MGKQRCQSQRKRDPPKNHGKRRKRRWGIISIIVSCSLSQTDELFTTSLAKTNTVIRSWIQIDISSHKVIYLWPWKRYLESSNQIIFLNENLCEKLQYSLIGIYIYILLIKCFGFLTWNSTLRDMPVRVEWQKWCRPLIVQRTGWQVPLKIHQTFQTLPIGRRGGPWVKRHS